VCYEKRLSPGSGVTAADVSAGDVRGRGTPARTPPAGATADHWRGVVRRSRRPPGGQDGRSGHQQPDGRTSGPRAGV